MINNIGIADPTTASISNLHVVMGTTDYSPYWQATLDKETGGGATMHIDALTSPDQGINYGISSACPSTGKRIYSGGIGGCAGGSNTVSISFHVSNSFVLSNANVFIKAGGNNSSECFIGSSCSTTTTPEPATIALVGTGLLALGGRVSRWRRRKDDT